MTLVIRRLLGLGQTVLGATTLVHPSATVRALTMGRGAVPDERIVRVLGARQLVQGIVLAAQPDAEVLAAGAVIDAVHAASLLPFIAFSRRYRPAAAVSALLAGSAAWGELRLAADYEYQRHR